MKTASIINRSKAIRLDIGCGGAKQPGFVGMDKRRLKGVDIVHDLEKFPYPLPDDICQTIVASHIIEHIKPWLMLDLMDELWRISKVGGQLAIAVPYGVNHLFVQDPTHCNPCNEVTFQYFCPDKPLYGIYAPKPWRIAAGFPSWRADGIMEVLMEKVKA